MKHIAFLLATLLPVIASAAAVDLADTPEKGLQPRLLVDEIGKLHALWYAGDAAGGDVFHAVRNPDKSWSQPVRVNSEPGSAVAMGTIRGAQAALGRDGFIHVVWNGSRAKLAKGTNAPMAYTRSTDGGKTFEPQRDISGEWLMDGGGAVAADAKGRVHVFWHGGNPNNRGEANRRVFIRSSEDDGKTFADERPISPEGLGVCGCCAMQALATRDGAGVYALFRSAFDNGMSRHIISLISHDSGKNFANAVVDKWKIAGCPMSSMSLAESPRGVIGAWESQGQVYLGVFDKLATSPTMVAAPEGKAGARKHPVLAVNANGEVLMAWAEGTGWQKGGTLSWEIFDKYIKPKPGSAGKSGGVPAWSFGGVAATPEGFVVVK